MNSGQEIAGELVVSGGDAAKVLEPAKAALDDISAFTGTLVEGVDDDAVGFVGDDGLGAATYDFAAKVVAVIPFVAEERAHGRRERQNIWRRRDIGILAWRQMQDDRPAERFRSAHGFLSCGRLASGRLLDCAPPFSAGGTPVSFSRGRVERKRDGIFAGLGQRLKDRAPSSAFCPTIEAIVDRRVRPVFRGAIAPPRTDCGI